MVDNLNKTGTSKVNTSDKGKRSLEFWSYIDSTILTSEHYSLFIFYKSWMYTR